MSVAQTLVCNMWHVFFLWSRLIFAFASLLFRDKTAFAAAAASVVFVVVVVANAAAWKVKQFGVNCQ